MKLMVSKHGLMDHQQQVVLGDTYDQQEMQDAEVFQVLKVTGEGTEKRESLTRTETGQ